MTRSVKFCHELVKHSPVHQVEFSFPRQPSDAQCCGND